MSQPGATAVLDREYTSGESEAESLEMTDETPGMDQTTPMRYSNQSSEPESGSHSPDEAQNGQNGGGTSDGDEGSS